MSIKVPVPFLHSRFRALPDEFRDATQFDFTQGTPLVTFNRDSMTESETQRLHAWALSEWEPYGGLLPPMPEVSMFLCPNCGRFGLHSVYAEPECTDCANKRRGFPAVQDLVKQLTKELARDRLSDLPMSPISGTVA